MDLKIWICQFRFDGLRSGLRNDWLF